MDWHPILRWGVQILGAALILSVLLDVFLTVLYARIGSGIISHYLACLMWRVFRSAARALPRWQDRILCFCGPCMLVALVSTWVLMMASGSALVVMPKLGTSVTATSGPTPTGFVTALYVAGDSLSTVGTSDMAPRTWFFRLFYTFISLCGISILTLTLTYFLEIYNALQSRNTFALKVHFATGETGDAAELIAGIGPRGKFEAGYPHVAEMAAEMLSFKESHHFYSVLLYFRFKEPHYAMSRLALVTLDTISLIKSALDDEKYGWLKESAAVDQLWRGSMHLLTLLATAFLPDGLPQADDPDEQTLSRWKRRYFAALRRLRQAEIATIEDDEAGAEVYVSLRARWDRYIRTFAGHMFHSMDMIDRAGSEPYVAEERQPFESRLRSVG